jgi:hypothetical protein
MPYHTNHATLRQFQEHRPSPDDGMAWDGYDLRFLDADLCEPPD